MSMSRYLSPESSGRGNRPSDSSDNPYADLPDQQTPEQQQERDIMDRIRNLAVVLMPKGKTIEYGPVAPENYILGKDEIDPENLGYTTSDREKRRQSDYMVGTKSSNFPLHHQKYSQVRISLRDLPSQHTVEAQKNLHQLTFRVNLLTHDGKSCLRLIQNQGGAFNLSMWDRDDWKSIKEVTDSTERLAKLNELYDIMSDLNASLPDKPAETSVDIAAEGEENHNG